MKNEARSSPRQSDVEHDELTYHLTQSTATKTPTSHPTILPATTFSFPTLDLDGSVSEHSNTSPSRHRTPPAALSSKGAEHNMALNMSSSTTSLNDGGFVMVDDDIRSDTSFDDGRTVSIASTEHADSDDGVQTPDDNGSLVDVEEQRDNVEYDTTIRGSFDVPPSQEQIAVEDAARDTEANNLMDSCFTDDLETPRQSMIHTEESLRHLFGCHLDTRHTNAPALDQYATPTLFVEALPQGTTPIALAKMFRKHGNVNKAHVCRNEGDCHGFVQMSCISGARAALNALHCSMSTTTPNGRVFLRVHYSDDKMWSSGVVPSIHHFWEYESKVNRKSWSETWADVKKTPLLKSCIDLFSERSIWWFLIASLLLTSLPLPSWLSSRPSLRDPQVTALRRLQLDAAVHAQWPYNPAISNINYTHLVPGPDAYNHTAGHSYHSAATCQYIEPGHILISLPQDKNGGYLSGVPVGVVRDNSEIVNFKHTQLIPSIYAATISPNETFGRVDVVMEYEQWKLSRLSWTRQLVHCGCDFGRPEADTPKPGVPTTGLSKMITKDLALAKERVKAYGEIIVLEVSAASAATRNITTELAVYVARDLQVFANTAVSVFKHAYDVEREALGAFHDVTHNTAVRLRSIQDALSTFTSEAKSAIASQRQKNAIRRANGKKYLRDSLIRSRHHALKLRSRLTGRPQDTWMEIAKELCRDPAFCPQDLHDSARAACLEAMSKCVKRKGFAVCQTKQCPVAPGWREQKQAKKASEKEQKKAKKAKDKEQKKAKKSNEKERKKAKKGDDKERSGHADACGLPHIPRPPSDVIERVPVEDRVQLAFGKETAKWWEGTGKGKGKPSKPCGKKSRKAA